MVGAGKLRHGVHQPLPHVGEAKGSRAGEGRDFVEVGASGEEMSVPGKNQARRRITRQPFHCGGERLHPRSRKPVGAVAGDQPQDDGIAARLDRIKLFLERGIHGGSG